MRDRAWQIAGTLGVAAIVVFVSSDTPMVFETAWTFASVGAAIAIPIGLRLHRPSRPRPWRTLGVAIGLLGLSNLLIHPLWVSPAIAEIADIIAIPALVLVAVGVFQMANAQVPGGDREGAIDAAIVMISTATALATTVHHPDRLEAGITGVEVLLHAVAGPLLMAAIVAGGMRLMFAGTGRLPAGWLLGLAAWGAMAGNLVRAEQVMAGTYARGSASELLVLAPYVLIGMAALHPSSAPLVEASTWRRRRLTHARLFVLGVALLVPPVTMMLSARDVQTLTGVATVLVGLLVLIRVSRLAVENDASRRELRQQAERQEALADLGRRALDADEPEQLVADAVALCTDQLGLASCEIVDRGNAPAADGDDAPLTQVIGLGTDGRSLVVRHTSTPDAEDAAFLASVATLITVAFERHDIESRLRWAATHDPLTGLANRARIHDLLDELLEGGDLTLSVLFLDLDDFKHVNDTYGHHVGDRVLTEVARRLQSGSRSTDVAGRIAGDEFVVICTDTTPAAAERQARELLNDLRRPYTIEGHTIVVGASAGVADAAPDRRDAEALLVAADAAMYEAKAAVLRST